MLATPVLGSSPLTRGKPRAGDGFEGSVRLIPAHAGKTARRSRPAWAARAHPRSRGENAKAAYVYTLKVGSSPLTRGKPTLHRCQQGRRRLIPAHAGKTLRSCAQRTPRRAHPRSRGENESAFGAVHSSSGSSPLTRGKQRDSLDWLSPPRLIPAHAGKTPTLRYASASARAHPRSRGENGSGAVVGAGAGGSSPLTRGKHGEAARRASRPGLIPAHAGKTYQPGPPRSLPGAHPRSRGENVGGDPQELPNLGSSPLTRGKHSGRGT